MTISTYVALVGIWVAAIASLGPDLVQIIRLGTKSRAVGVACAVGIMLGNTVWIAASLLGLSALIKAVPEVLAVLQLVGGIYLLFMGVGAIRAGLSARKLQVAEPGTEQATAHANSKELTTAQALRIGVYTNLSNPKAVLFFGAVFAQFITPGMGWEWMLLILITLVVIGFGWFVGFAVLVDKLASFLARWGHVVDLVTGLVFVALAVWMLVGAFQVVLGA
ncbi:LysE family translocator [Corynebacterium sp. MSK041]|uniref:LysE family translocator n=1 Tax=Corynebacterium sp. MSK041 TaxID=3050194 RepID=UPI00254C0FFB|nr:LysE family translocator [Corynebacterium sp. MSK041]MDK8795435.1 LysE family translocator [Corynebacterium sp. MSK041]